jgi:hypothetical protein
MLTVHIRVTDSATGKPTPVRARFSGPAGETYVPFGRLANFSTEVGQDVGGHLLQGLRRFVYLDGAGEIQLPAGVPITVELFKGPEYSPLQREVTLGAGQISLRFALDRWIDLRSEGWYAGDTRVLRMTPHAALLECAAEGLAVVNLLAAARPTADILAFSGTRPALEAPGHLVAVNTLNAQPTLGTVALLDSHRPVFPLEFGGPAGNDDWSVVDWCDQCHRKRGLVVWCDLPRLTATTPQGEALAAALLGRIDAFEISAYRNDDATALADWYDLLDCGVRLPLAGGSGKESNAVAVGAMRTYACLVRDQEFNYAAWVEAVRAGRTFVTNGPLLTLDVEGEGPGHLFTAIPEDRPIRLRAEARSGQPFDVVEVIYNGQVVAERQASGDRQAAVLETGFRPDEPGWLAARCGGSARLADGQLPFAHTSPVWFHPEGERPVKKKEAADRFNEILHATETWAAKIARYENPKSREHLSGLVAEAKRALGIGH